MEQKRIFSLYKSSAEIDKYETLMQMPLSGIEVSGDFFESEDFHNFYLNCFKNKKAISSVYGVLPSNLTRNWSSADKAIKEAILAMLRKKITRAAPYGIRYFVLDLGLDNITDANEYEELQERLKLFQPLLKEAAAIGLTFCIPIRFPKTFPHSGEWQMANLLKQMAMHPSLALVMNAFPGELPPKSFNGVLKKCFYSIKLIRFCYDNELENSFEATHHENVMNILEEQGYDGDLIYVPSISNKETLQRESSFISSVCC